MNRTATLLLAGVGVALLTTACDDDVLRRGDRPSVSARLEPLERYETSADVTFEESGRGVDMLALIDDLPEGDFYLAIANLPDCEAVSAYGGAGEAVDEPEVLPGEEVPEPGPAAEAEPAGDTEPDGAEPEPVSEAEVLAAEPMPVWTALDQPRWRLDPNRRHKAMLDTELVGPRWDSGLEALLGRPLVLLRVIPGLAPDLPVACGVIEAPSATTTTARVD